MIIHIALFKFKPEISNEDINHAMVEVRSLKDKIPQVVEIFAGENFSKHSKGFTHAIVVKFASREDIDTYRAHPDHKPIADKLDSLEDDSIGIDFEV
ncbi:MAG: Dabb family protein [bacterium]|nr:Dabb family protein [bacterium]